MSQPFDPDAYLAKKRSAAPEPQASAAFNPDAYLAKKSGPTRTDALGRGALQGATMGFGDEVAGAMTSAMQAGTNLLPKSLRERWDLVEAPAGDAYRYSRDEERRKNAEAEEAHGGAYLAGNILGGVATLPLMPGGAVAGRGAGLGARVGVGALNGLTQGAIFGLGASNADLTRGEVGQALRDTRNGALLGAGLGGALPLAGAAAGAAGRRIINGIVQPNDAAIFLQSRGVPLTLGQMRPGGVINQLEESATSLPGVGPAIAGQREAAREAWQNVVMNEARAPGAEALDRSRSLQERLADAYEGFADAYALPKAAEVRPEVASGAPLAQAFANAIDDPAAMATEGTQNVVTRFLDDQLSLLPQARRPEMGGRVPAETLLAMRSSIREAKAQAAKSQDFPREALLSNAEAEVTDALQSHLPDWASDALRATDARYRTYKTVEDAVARAGDRPSGFGPYNLEQAVRGSTEKGRFARGAGGELRELAAAGREAFETKAPQTGARILTMAPLGYATAPLSYLANLPRVQPYMTGTAPIQQRLQSLEQGALGELMSGLRNPVGAETRAFLPSDAPPSAPAFADEDERKRNRYRALTEALTQ